MKKRWYEYKQPKRRWDAFCEENKDKIHKLTMSPDEVTNINTDFYFTKKQFVQKSWEEFMKNDF